MGQGCVAWRFAWRSVRGADGWTRRVWIPAASDESAVFRADFVLARGVLWGRPPRSVAVGTEALMAASDKAASRTSRSPQGGRRRNRRRRRAEAPAGSRWYEDPTLAALLEELLEAVGPTSVPLRPPMRPPVSPEVQRAVRVAIARVEAVLQDPAGDVRGALSGLAAHADVFEPRLFDLACRLLVHGHEAELVDFLVAARPSSAAPSEVLAIHQLIAVCAGEVELLRLAQLEDGAERVPEMGRRLALSVDEEEARLQIELHHQLAEGALDRRRYRQDRPGSEVVPLVEGLTRRFSHLLYTHWGWSLGRVALARLELYRLLLLRYAPELVDAEHGNGMLLCRDCALDVPARQDLAKGATVLHLDVNGLILEWPSLIESLGGLYRGAVLLEALPLWMRFLESLKLVDPPRSESTRTMLDRSSRMLAPTLLRMPPDRALAAAAARIGRQEPMVA